MPIATILPIRFSDVCTELYSSSNTLGKTLSQAFIDATGTFDATYESINGYHNSLQNFRGYEHSDTENPDWGLEPAPVISNLTSTTLTVSWTAATDNIGIDKYVVTIELQNGTLVQTSPDISSGTFTYDVTGLTASTFYQVIVWAWDAAGNNIGNSVNTTTLSGDILAPSIPQNVRFSYETAPL